MVPARDEAISEDRDHPFRARVPHGRDGQRRRRDHADPRAAALRSDVAAGRVTPWPPAAVTLVAAKGDMPAAVA